MTVAIGVLVDIDDEMERQVRKWGVQNHASVDPVLMNRPGGCTSQRMAEEYEIPTANRARQRCQTRGGTLPDTWAHILIEEVAEAIEAAVIDTAALRAELVQVAAVAASWIACLDRNAA